MDNKIPENGIKVENAFVKKLDNFWYYHKWKVIIAAFVAFVVAVCVYSCLSKPKTDITVLYAGPVSSQNTAILNMNDTLTEVMPESVGKNGAAMNVLSIYTEERARKLAEDTVNRYIEEEKKNGRYYDSAERESLIKQQIDRYNSVTADGINSLGSYIGMGNYTVYLLDPSLYEKYSANEVFVLLSDVFGEDVPLSAYSEDAIKLCETEIYKNDPDGIGQLPADTLVCLRVEPVFGGCGGKNSANYEKAVEMFRAMVK